MVGSCVNLLRLRQATILHTIEIASLDFGNDLSRAELSVRCISKHRLRSSVQSYLSGNARRWIVVFD
jgi:hypothetical protein